MRQTFRAIHTPGGALFLSRNSNTQRPKEQSQCIRPSPTMAKSAPADAVMQSCQTLRAAFRSQEKQTSNKSGHQTPSVVLCNHDQAILNRKKSGRQKFGSGRSSETGRKEKPRMSRMARIKKNKKSARRHQACLCFIRAIRAIRGPSAIIAALRRESECPI
jgi:hypothetical protein